MQLIRQLFGKKNRTASGPLDAAKLTPQRWLVELFQRHGLAPIVHEDWLLPTGELPGIRGTWHPGATHGRLDMQVLVHDGVLIEECFAGMGTGDLGLADGLQNFTINAFHVLLSALWCHHDPDQVVIETWTVDGRTYNAYIGNVGTRSSTGVTPSVPANLMPVLQTAIAAEPLARDLHWFRFYVGNVKNEFTLEALLDNEPWPSGLEALASCGWAPCDSFYSARLFMILREMVDEAPSEAGSRRQVSCSHCA